MVSGRVQPGRTISHRFGLSAMSTAGDGASGHHAAKTVKSSKEQRKTVKCSGRQ